jgi:DNA-binding transcriptional LysR family regulator
VIASVTNSALSECLEVFCERYPAVSIRVTGGYTTDFLEMLQIGQLDIAMVNRSRGKVGLPAIPMMREDFVMISAPGTMIADREGISLKTAATMRLIIPSTRHGLRTILDEAAHDIGVRLEPALELDELKTIEELVQRTDFVTILPPAAVDRSLRNGLLKSTPIVPSVTRDIVCVHNPKRALSPAAELFIAELRAKMSTVIIPSEPTHRYP